MGRGKKGNKGNRNKGAKMKRNKAVAKFTPFDVPKTVKHARSDAKLSHTTFQERLIEWRGKKKLKGKERAMLDALIGKRPMKGKIRASDLRAALKLANLLITEMRDLIRVKPELEFFSVTCLIDEGVSTDRVPLIPLDGLFRKMYKAFNHKELDLHGLMFAEISAINNYPQHGHGRAVHTHGHALLWSTKHKTASAVAYYVSQSRMWSCALGAKPIVVKRIDPDDMGSAAWWAYYFTKAPHKVKRLREHKDASAPGGMRIELQDTSKGYPAELAVILMQILSYIPLTGMIRSIGDGKYSLARAKSKLAIWHKVRCKKRKDEIVEDFDIDRFWKFLKQTRRVKYARPIILGPEM